MLILFFLFIYQSSFYGSKIAIFPQYRYAFKKNAHVFLKFSNLSSKIVFGLIQNNKLPSVDNSNCDGHEKISDIQFMINNSDTSFNFTIPTKCVLTPYSTSCDEVYKFNIELNILNTKNHLDSRFQVIMTCALVFLILLSILFVALSLLHFLYLRKKGYKSIYHFLIFILISILQNLSIYLNYSKNENIEFFQFDKKYELMFNILFILNLIQLCFFNLINENSKFFYSKFKVFKIWLTLNILNIILEIVMLVINIKVSDNEAKFYACFVLFFLILLIILMTPNIFWLMKGGIFCYLNGGFLTLVSKSSMIERTKETYSIGFIQMLLYIISYVSIFLSIFFFLIDYLFVSRFSTFKKLEIQDDINFDENFSVNEQRSFYLSHARSELEY